jgi:3-hydroxyisobutyrate dehydrogenase
MACTAFLELGNMGLPMARNLGKAGHAVTGFDPAKPSLPADAGVAVAPSIGAAVNKAEFVLTMLSAGPHVAAAYSEDGI